MKTRLTRPTTLPALAASAVCGLTLYALRRTLSYLFRDVEVKEARTKKPGDEAKQA